MPSIEGYDSRRLFPIPSEPDRTPLEYIQDMVAAMIVPGNGITKTYDDVVGTLTLVAAGTSSPPVSTTVAGIVPILPGDATKFFNGAGGYTAPPAATGGGGTSSALTGLSITQTNTGAYFSEITPTDTVLSAFEKTRFQLSCISTERVNILKYLPTNQTDITEAINLAINEAMGGTNPGGVVFIPKGRWVSAGGHQLKDGLTIQGEGFSGFWGGRNTEIKMKTPTFGNQGTAEMFVASGNVQNWVIKDLGIDLTAKPNSGTGLLISGSGAAGNYKLKSELENVGFNGGRYGIKVQSADGSPQNDGFSAMNCSFWYTRQPFYCDSNNGSYYFWKPFIYLPLRQTLSENTDSLGASLNYDLPDGIAFYGHLIPTLIVEKHHIVGVMPAAPGSYDAGGVANNKCKILQTFGTFNKIVFKEGQDEGCRYFYFNDRNDGQGDWSVSPIVLRNNSIQSIFETTSGMAFELDGNYIINKQGTNTFYDTPAGFIHIYKTGPNDVETRGAGVLFRSRDGSSSFAYLGHPKSKIVDMAGNIKQNFNATTIDGQGTYGGGTANDDYILDAGWTHNLSAVMPASKTILAGGSWVNSTHGVINIPVGMQNVDIFNKYAQLWNGFNISKLDAVVVDGLGVTITSVSNFVTGTVPYFRINLSAPTTVTGRISFRISGYDGFS